MNYNVKRDFQICISVPLIYKCRLYISHTIIMFDVLFGRTKFDFFRFENMRDY